ncbi:MAG TPA: lytic transglycosylase domain-containing protein [Candidatus Polarisedimenticolaceae bacterium]|nr:lytic transglycosylase domain-containing protein [Candidatus Polarisedimenticolaceae bacterium]
MKRIRRDRPIRYLVASVLLTTTAAVSPVGSRASLAGAIDFADLERERVERAAILELVQRHRPADERCWQRHVAEVIYSESKAVGIDPLLTAAIVARESSFRSRAESEAGALGLMQVRPFVAQDVALRRGVAWGGSETLHDPRLNVRLGTSYYGELLSRFDGDVTLALAAYHRGPTRLSRQIREGSFSGAPYAGRVLHLYARLDAERQERLGQAGL